MLVTNLQKKMESLKANNSDQVEEIEQVKFFLHGLASELVEAKSRLGQVVQDCATAKSTITSLNQQLDQMEELRGRADRVPGLAHDSEVKDGIITVLEQKLESLNIVNQRLQCYQVEDEKRALEISELKARLQTAEEAAQQLLVVQGELHSHEEELRTLKGARERAISLERELCQTKNRMSELNIVIANSNDSQRQLEDLRTETCHRGRDCENIEKRLRASEEEAARPPVLEKEISAQKAEIRELRAKLAEAERISKALPEMQTQMDQFSETFSSLQRELEDAHQTGNEVQSTRTVNAKLHQTIAELRNQAADAEQAGVSMKSLSDEMQQKDVQITSLRTELARLGIESQRQIETREPNTEDLLDGGPSQDTCRLAEANHTHQQDDSIHSHHSTVENEPAATPDEELELCKKRKRADRSASSVQANTSPCEEIVLVSKTSGKTDSEVGTAHKTFADDGVGDQGSIELDVDETDLIPESQPRMNDSGRSLGTDSMRSQSVSKIISSSPLSDVGEIFDPADQDQPVSDYYAYRKHSDQMSGTAARDDIAAMNKSLGQEESLPGEKSPLPESLHRARSLATSNQERRPSSSSFGEPLLLDDLEGLGSLPAGDLMNLGPSKQPSSSIQDIPTSPMGALPRKLSAESTRPRSTATSPSKSYMKAVDVIGYRQHLAKEPSPRRLRSSEPASQTNTRRPLQDLDNDATNARPTTPNVPVKEKHQPNSAIKRKSEAASVLEENTTTEKKRTKLDLSNIEVARRSGRGSRSFSSSTPGTVEQTLTRLRTSSTSATSSRNTIVGKNAPAPGVGKHGSRKPRGGSKSEECLIITISRRY